MYNKLILIEFNELCPPLLQQWMDAGLLPNFHRFFADSTVFTTEADVTDYRCLEPWIQWYSVHTGLSFDQHGVFRLTDGPRVEHDDIWRVLKTHGKRVGNCSSMNARRFDAADEGFFIADPWCNGERASPDELNAFQDFVSRAVLEYTNESNPTGIADYLRFVGFLTTHGLRPKTVSAIVKQLAVDKFIDRYQSWKRPSMADLLQFDVFRNCFRKYHPDFATFFVNSTAHYQHTYWRHMEPDKFDVQPAAEERKRYKDAVLYGYQSMDKLLADFLPFETDGAMLVLATALSQQPFLKYESSGGQHFYRPRDVHGLLGVLGITYDSVEPVMTHQFMLRTLDQSSADDAEQRLGTLRYQDSEVLEIVRQGATEVYFGGQIRSVVPADAELTLAASGNGLSFYDLFYEIDGIKSGCHHPDGVLWFKGGDHVVIEDKVSILDIYPTILDYFGIPLSTDSERSGRSLLAQFQPQRASAHAVAA